MLMRRSTRKNRERQRKRGSSLPDMVGLARAIFSSSPTEDRAQWKWELNFGSVIRGNITPLIREIEYKKRRTHKAGLIEALARNPHLLLANWLGLHGAEIDTEILLEVYQYLGKTMSEAVLDDGIERNLRPGCGDYTEY